MKRYSFIHSVFCPTTGPKPPPKRFLHIVRSRASSFNWEYPLLSLRSSTSFLRLLPHLLVTSISPFIFPSITCFRKQFLRKMWPIQLAFHFLISCRIFLCSLTLSNTSWFIYIYIYIYNRINKLCIKLVIETSLEFTMLCRHIWIFFVELKYLRLSPYHGGISLSAQVYRWSCQLETLCHIKYANTFTFCRLYGFAAYYPY